MVQGLSVISR